MPSVAPSAHSTLNPHPNPNPHPPKRQNPQHPIPNPPSLPPSSRIEANLPKRQSRTRNSGRNPSYSSSKGGDRRGENSRSRSPNSRRPFHTAGHLPHSVDFHEPWDGRDARGYVGRARSPVKAATPRDAGLLTDYVAMGWTDGKSREYSKRSTTRVGYRDGGKGDDGVGDYSSPETSPLKEKSKRR